jgi:acylglycerol lipase
MSVHRASEAQLESSDGFVLACRSWLPPDPRAAVLAVHGLGEHSGRYEHVGQYLAGARLACHALDCRGHGCSAGLRVHVDRFDEYLADVAVARAHVAALHPRLPLFLLGHSQGGLIVLLSGLTTPSGLAGAVVSSPFLGLHPTSRPPAPLALAARALSRLAPRVRIDNGIDVSLLSHDTGVVDAYRADPLVSSRVSARWFTEVGAAHERVLARAPELRVPLLVMQSGADRLVYPAATRRWVAAAPPPLVEYVEWEGLYHEMLNEPEKLRVLARVVAWLAARLTASAPPPR